VYVDFDPVSLKNTKQLAKVDMKLPEKGLGKKIALLNVTIELEGPAAEVESWARKIDTKRVLAQIDSAN